MDRILTFATNHYILVSAFFLLWAYFFFLETRRGGETLSPQMATNLVNRDDGLILDIRKSEEFREGHIAGSINIPNDQIAERIAELEKYRDKPLVLVCNSGTTTAHAGRFLKTKGFQRVGRISGGLQGWRNENLPVVKS